MPKGSYATDAERRERSKDVYETVVGAVEHNSGTMQPPLAKKASVIGTVHRSRNARYDLDEINSAIRAALSNGDLFEVEDGRGDKRLGINDAERLVGKISSYVSWVNEGQRRNDIIGLANARVQYLRNQGGLE